MSVFMVTVTGYEYGIDGERSPVELIFFANGETDEQALTSITTGSRVRVLAEVTNVVTEKL